MCAHVSLCGDGRRSDWSPPAFTMYTPRPNVHVEKGRWQEAVARLAGEGKRFDAVFFDTYAEHYRDMQVGACVDTETGCFCVGGGMWFVWVWMDGWWRVDAPFYT